jgi:ankyrin repeat protein
MNALGARRRKLLAVALAAGIVAGVWLSLHQMRQSRLDGSLIAAIRGSDTPAAVALLDQGADANAVARLGHAESPGAMLEAAAYWLHGRRPPNRGAAIPALYLVYAVRYREPARLPSPAADPRRGGRALSEPRSAAASPASPQVPSPTHSGASERTDPAASTDAPLINALLEHGADPNYYPGRSGPLEMAIRAHDAEAVRLLLEHHADPNARGASSEAPLMFADAACTRLLIQHGADIDIRNRLGITPLMAAAADRGPGAAERVAILLEHGANPNLNDAYGQTPLMHAVSLDVARMLLQRGAEIDAVANYGRTALLMDCENNCDPAVPRFLIQRGADVRHKDWFGHSAVDYARRKHRADLVALLTSSGGSGRPPAKP